MGTIILAESGTSVVAAKKTAKKKYKCPYCEARIERAKLHIHIQDEHEDLIPEGYTAMRVAFNAINHKTEGHCIICKGVTDWNEDKARYERLCNNPACHEAYKKIVAERNKRIYGTDRLQTDPRYADYVQRKALEGRKMSGKYKFADGGVLSYMGSYERKFLEFMDTVMHAESEDILAPGPSIKYMFQGQEHIYISDFFYVPYNLIIEIKDGGRNKNTHPKRLGEEEERIRAKEKAVEELQMFNYVRITDNDFGQLMSIMAVLKFQYWDQYTGNDYVIRVNEAASLVEVSGPDTPKKLYDWMKKNIKYKSTGILLSPEEVEKNGYGDCHDQALFEKVKLEDMGYKCGRLFMVEYHDWNSTGGATHTACYYKDYKGYYWFENAWKSKSGIHGPYDSITDLKKDIARNWQWSGKNDKLYMSNIGNVKPGMTLEEYVVACTPEEEVTPFMVKGKSLKEDMSGTIGAALPPTGATAPIVPTPSPMPYETDKDNYYVVQHPKKDKDGFSYSITKDPLQYSMVSVDPLEKGFYKVYKTDKGKINKRSIDFKIKGAVSESVMISGETTYEDLKAKVKTIKNPHDDKTKAVKINFYDKSDEHIGEVCISSADTNNGFLYDLEVFSKYRGKGYGRKIMMFVLKNYKVTDLTVDLDNEIAINLYKSLGFKIKQKWKDPTSGKTVYWMVRKANASIAPVKENYLTFKIKDREAGKRLYNELYKIAESTGEICDLNIKSDNYIYETLTEGSIILDPDQMMFDSRFELVDNPKEKEKKSLIKLYNWIKGGNLDKLQEQVDALESNQKGEDAYHVLPDGNMTVAQLKQWEHDYLMMPYDQRIISNDISTQKYGTDNLTRYNKKYSEILQRSDPEKVDIDVQEASIVAPVENIGNGYKEKLDRVKQVECDTSIIIMVLTDREYEFDRYTSEDIDELKEKWNRYIALPQEYRVLSSQTATNIFGIDNDNLFNKAINAYLAKQEHSDDPAESEFPMDEFVMPYYIPSDKVLKSNPEGIFDESGCIDAYKYTKTLQRMQHALKCSKTEADRKAIREQIIDYGWNPEIPCTEAALKKTYMRFEPKAIQEIDAKAFLESQDAMEDIPADLTSDYLKDKIVPIFVVLVHGNRLHSKGIRWFTDSEWSHAALSLESSLDEMYTFTTGIDNAPNKRHKTGFAIDTKERYLHEDPHMKVKVYALFITPEQKKQISDAIQWYIDHQDETSYGFKNILNIFLHRPTKRKIKSGDKCKMICSQFVYTMLSLVNFKMKKNKDSSTISPADIDQLSDDTRFYVVYQGGLDKYDHTKVDDLCYRLLPTLPMEMYGINESTGKAFAQPKSAIGKSNIITKVFEMAEEFLNN